jgi:membrane-bound lytic murein transglycosylase D
MLKQFLNHRWKWISIGLVASGIGVCAFALEMVPDDGITGPESEPVLQTEEVMPQTGEVPQFTALNPKWTPPDYSRQENALGWSPEAFNIPKGMEERVQFWKDIYTKYTSDQGLLHDSQFVHVVYESVDFGDITAQTDLSDRQREKARRKRVDEKKKEIADRLKRLAELKTSEGLTGEDLRYWEMFAKVDEPKKFQDAARKGRLRFQLGQRNQFINGIYSSGRYISQMEDIFRKAGVPVELTRLPFVESSFNLRARSRVGASGIWQFMRSTGRMYMRLDASADERNDPLRATVAAAKKMRDNFNMLKSWPLAVTAYNHGPSGVRRLTEKMGTTDLAELTDVRKGRFGFASASFYASFLAALDVERNAEKYFGPLEVMPELRGAEVKLVQSKSWKDMAKWFNNDVDAAKLLNPHVVDAVWKGKTPLTRKHTLRVPLTQESQARAELE